jgi:protein SCO1/2
MPDFTLTDQNLREFNLHAVKGRVVLLFFGYASCPDVCPAVLSKYAILEKLLGDKAERVVMIFVTTDPLRDNAAVLKELASHYSEHIVALTGDWEELEDAWLKYHVMARDTQPPSMTDYYVAHSAIVYVADQDLTLRYILTPEMPVERYYETVNRLLENE